jgi:dihydropteroate synthase
MAHTVTGLPAQFDALERCVVMGVVNVTPDSFSDGGRYVATEAALARGRQLSIDGADLVDIGGESTRPGAQRVPLEVELDRVIPVVRELASEGVAVSVDTMRAAVADAAIAAGAVMVNDVSGGQADPQMLPFLASSGVPSVLMHWRGHSTTMMALTDYPGGVVADVVAELRDRLDAAERAGVDVGTVVLDPGIGFAKVPADNWPLLAHLADLEALGRPVLVGASRKRFLGELLADADGDLRLTSEREDATTAVSALVAAAGAWGVRVHDVRGSLDAVRVAAAWKHASRSAVAEPST